jgi:phosphohistidine phosphatase
MTLNVHILRHAQSPMMGDDFDRPLSDKGIADMVALAANKENQKNCKIDYCFCSPARRTRKTLQVITQNGFGDIKAEYPELLYNAPAGMLYEVIKRADQAHKSVLVVAHNPGVYDLAVFLAKPEESADFRFGYKPGTLTSLQFDCDDWGAIQPHSGTVKNILIPNG